VNFKPAAYISPKSTLLSIMAVPSDIDQDYHTILNNALPKSHYPRIYQGPLHGVEQRIPAQRDCITIRHPGLAPWRGERSGIQRFLGILCISGYRREEYRMMRSQNPPSDFRLCTNDSRFWESPGHQQDVRCKPKIPDFERGRRIVDPAVVRGRSAN